MGPVFVAVALAAPIVTTVSGVGEGSAVALWVKGEEGSRFVGCADTGSPPDRAADGLYTCAPFERPPAPTALFLLHETGVVGAGDAVDGAGATLHLALEGATLRVEPSPPTAPQPGGRGAGSLLLLHLIGVPAGRLPALSLATPSGTVQLRCRDDGGFPDLVRNDGEPGCAGRLGAGSATLWLNGQGGGRQLGKLTVEGAVAWLRVDATAGTITPESAALPEPGRDLPPSPVPPKPPEPVPPEGVPPTPPEPVPPEGVPPTPPEPVPPEGVPPTPPEPVPGAPTAPPEPTAPAPPRGPPVSAGVAWLSALLLAAGGVLAWQRRQARRALPSCLLPVAAPRSATPAESLTGPGVLVESDDPAAAAARLLARAAATRRVILLSDDDVEPPTDSAGVWRSTCTDWIKVSAAAAQLARSPGPPVAVVVVGADTVRDPGSVSPAPLANLVSAMPPGTWLGVSLRPGEAADCPLPRETTDAFSAP
jgi:hypothetical protein